LVFCKKRAFIARSIASWAFVFTLIKPIGINISLNNYFSYKASLITSIKVIYLAIIVAIVIVFYLVLAQLIELLNIVKTILEVNL